MKIPDRYSDNVFINCPFDQSYTQLFRAIVFTVHDCGFIPRCALEEDTATENRLAKIFRIIDQCKSGIHDISKADLDAATRLARFNMPLELGAFLGAQTFADRKHYNKEKKALVSDIERYRYRNFVSDISGMDIKAHDGKISNAISITREFLFNNSHRTSIASGKFISERFQRFTDSLPDLCTRLKWRADDINFLSYSVPVTGWIKNNYY
jgi:hypothetical protein